MLVVTVVTLLVLHSPATGGDWQKVKVARDGNKVEQITKKNSDISINKIVLAECKEGCGQNIPGNYLQNPEDVLRWNPANPQTITRNTSRAVSVIGGTGPYKWSVSGTGFTLNNSTSTSNTLNANNSACGSASITVTDKYGDTVSGSLRCTSSGEWVRADNDYCAIPGDGTYLGDWKYTRTEGKYKIDQRYKAGNGSHGSYGPCTCDDYVPLCETEGCDYQPQQCITFKHPGADFSGEWPCYDSCVSCGTGYGVPYCCKSIRCMDIVYLNLYEWKCP